MLFHDDFEDGFGNWGYITPQASIITDSANVHAGTRSAKITATRNVNTGGNLEFYPNPGREKLYMRYCLKLDQNSLWPHHIGGISAIRPNSGYWPNAGTKPAGDTAFWSSLEPDTINGGKYWNLYSYWHEMRSWANPDGSTNQSCLNSSTCYYGNNFTPVQTEQVQKNRWYCIEAMLKSNTPGLYDGEQAFWIDGVLMGDYKTGGPTGNWLRDNFYSWGPYFNQGTAAPFAGYNWRTNSSVQINKAQIQWYLDNFTGATQSDQNLYVDDVVVATDYIGPISNGTNNPPETNPTVTNGPFIVAGAGPGATPRVRAFNRNGQMISDFYAFEKTFKGGVFVATADTNADGTDEIIVGAGPGRKPEVRVFSKSGTRLATFSAYSGTFFGGVHVAGGDINGDGADEIITGAGPGARAYVRVFQKQGGTYRAIKSFDLIAYSSTFKGGVFVASLDSNGDGRDELVTAPGAGVKSTMNVYSSSNNKFSAIQTGLLAYSATFRGGTNIIGGNINNGAPQELITGAGPGARPYVRIFGYQNNRLTLLSNGFIAFSATFRGGVNIAAADTNLDGTDEIITAAGSGSEPLVRIWSSNGKQILRSFYAFSRSFKGGLTVATGE